MPNGGPTPDCMHCKHAQGDFRVQLECGLHHIKLAYPIGAFCSQYIEPDEYRENWLESMLDRTSLQSDMMYVWMNFYLKDKEGVHSHVFDFVPLTLIAEYGTWTRENFWIRWANWRKRNAKNIENAAIK